tara:strand:- start:9313 stop:9627 length:315 start_codon:yes stop_codon:yes gene_type:complete
MRKTTYKELDPFSHEVHLETAGKANPIGRVEKDFWKPSVWHLKPNFGPIPEDKFEEQKTFYGMIEAGRALVDMWDRVLERNREIENALEEQEYENWFLDFNSSD